MTPADLEALTARTATELVRLAGLSAESGVRFTVGDVAELVLSDLPAGLEPAADLRALVVELALELIAGGVIEAAALENPGPPRDG